LETSRFDHAGGLTVFRLARGGGPDVLMLVARAGGRNLEHDIKIIFAVQVCWPPCL
jgi:hypothetical protein